MILDSTTTVTNIQLFFGSPRVFLASSLLFEVVDFGTKLGEQATASVALINERLGGGDFSQGYLVTELEVPVYQPNQVILRLNLDAPIIFIPSRVEVKEGPTIVVDLGRVTVFHDSGPIDKPPDFLEYDIDMRDMNAHITEGDSCDPAAYEDRAIIKKFDMHFNVSARNCQNFELPETKLSGKLPEMNIFMTKEKLRDILIVAGSIKPETFVTKTDQRVQQTALQAPFQTLASSQLDIRPEQTSRTWILDSFFEIGALNISLRDTKESTSDRGTSLARVSMNGIRAKFDLTNQDMFLDAKLDRLRVKDRTPVNKTSAAKNLVASPKGMLVLIFLGANLQIEGYG